MKLEEQVGRYIWFVVYLTMPSVIQTTRYTAELLDYNESENMWKEMVVTKF
jgi:hypothetical protein